MTRRGVIAGMACAGALIASGCGSLFPETYRYRLIVEVETPQGVQSAASVIEVVTSKGVGFPGPEAGGFQSKLRGEAVAVDLPSGTLFALLRTADNVDGASGYAPNAFAPRYPAGIETDRDWRAQFRFLRTVRGPAEVPRWLPKPYAGAKTPPSGYPLLVRFRDIRDPKSVEQVNPDDLAASFGPGVRLQRITVQITGNPVTTGIEKRLGWLGNFPEPSLNPAHLSNDFSLPATLRHGDFRRTEK